MNKTLILSVLIGGIYGNISTPIAIQPVTAAPLPQLERSLAATPATIEVLTPGAEPRRELKFRPAANSKQTMVMTMGMSMDMSMDNNPLPKMPIPKMVIKTDLNVQKVDPSGDIHYNFAYGDIKVISEKDTPPAMLAAMQKSLKSVAGIQGNLVINSSGLIKSKNIVLPKTVDPRIKETLEQFNQSIDQVSTQLPSGMLGVGGKWQVNNVIQSGGIKFNQSAIYEILEISDIGMTVQTKITQSALPQDLKLPNLGKDVQAKLTSLNSTGEGQYRVKFDSLLPIAGKLLLNTNSKMSIKVSPKEPLTNVVNNIAINLNISDK
ncbi:MAG: hypothetical protein LH474_01065 [Chamaesiphon sp.]|nr:hypothetical protein [Chamaesiphon sp.]